MVSATVNASAADSARQQHRELLAADSAPAQSPARRTESEMQIAMPTSTWSPAWWPIGVVVGLEMIGIDHQQRDRRLAARTARRHSASIS